MIRQTLQSGDGCHGHSGRFFECQVVEEHVEAATQYAASNAAAALDSNGLVHYALTSLR
jgi:hypothetical protein